MDNHVRVYCKRLAGSSWTVQDDALPHDSIAGMLFHLAHCLTIEQMHDLVHTLRKRLRHGRYDGLRRR